MYYRRIIEGTIPLLPLTAVRRGVGAGAATSRAEYDPGIALEIDGDGGNAWGLRDPRGVGEKG